MTTTQTTAAARTAVTTAAATTNPGGRSFERERDESLRIARAIILGLVFSPLFWIIVVVGVRQVGALLDLP